MSDKAIKVAHCKAGTVANISLWEDVTVFLDPNNAKNQLIQVALERDVEPYGKVVDWYAYDEVHVQNDHGAIIDQTIQIHGTFRYLRVVSTYNGQQELPFIVSGKVSK